MSGDNKQNLLEQFAAKAVEMNFDEIEVEYKGGYENICAMKNGLGLGIGEIESNTDEAKALRNSINAIGRKGKIMTAAGKKYRLTKQTFDSFGEIAYRVKIEDVEKQDTRKGEGQEEWGVEINFECKKCGKTFDCDVGIVTLPEDSERPCFEKKIICPVCGERSMDDVFLTELGQGQLTEATFDMTGPDWYEPWLDDEPWDDDDDEPFEYECQRCDKFLPLDDMGLCEECAGKLERDLIRQRDWESSVTAYGVDPSKLEELRKQVIAEHGEKLELTSSPPAENKNRKKRERKKVKKKKRSR